MTERRRDHIDLIVAQWRRERPDLKTAPLELWGRLFRTAHLADAALGRMLSQHQLQAGWFDVLAALRRAGPPHELNPTQLMRTTMLSSGGMTKRLDRLAEAGLIERKDNPDDRRGTLIKLTRRGKATVDKAIEAHLANEEYLLRSLTSAQRRTLDELLRMLLIDLENRDASGLREVSD